MEGAARRLRQIQHHLAVHNAGECLRSSNTTVSSKAEQKQKEADSDILRMLAFAFFVKLTEPQLLISTNWTNYCQLTLETCVRIFGRLLLRTSLQLYVAILSFFTITLFRR